MRTSEGTMRVPMTVNGTERIADDVWPGESLLYVLRERLGLPGSKNACEQGECGSCTVLLDGVPVCSCLVAAGQAEGRSVTTVEGLGDLAGRAPGAGGSGSAGDGPSGPDLAATLEPVLSPVQRAFLAAGAVQCGFCTPGLLVATTDLLYRHPDPSDLQIREALAGNLCRCTGYEKIIQAVHAAAAELAGSAS
jgi:carbon-monoxide dehydrogenase small subunit